MTRHYDHPMRNLGLSVLLCASTIAPAVAAPCSGAPAELATAAAAWAQPDVAIATAIQPSIPSRVSLGPPSGAGFALRPKPETEGRHAAAFDFRATANGEHAIVVGQRMWIDIVDARGRLLVPARVERGLRCDGIAKTLIFALVPGDYRLQLSEGASSSTRVLIIALAAPPRM